MEFTMNCTLTLCRKRRKDETMFTPNVGNIIDIFRAYYGSLQSFEDILRIGGFEDCFNFLEKQCGERILSPIAPGFLDKVVLHWEGKEQIIPGGSDFYRYIGQKKLRIVENSHP
jgi:hypothetical protein